MNDLESRQFLRREVLRLAYDFAGDDTNKGISLATIASHLQRSPRDLHTALDYLESGGLIRIYASSGDDRAFFITRLGIEEAEQMNTASSQATTSSQVVRSNSQSRIRLFISHSSEDAPLTAALVDLLQSALNLPHDSIRCTSVPGYRLDAGADTDDNLRAEISESTTFIGLLSQTSLESTYVVMELGTRWATNRHLIPLVAPSVDLTKIKDPLKQKHALRIADSNDLFQLVGDIGKVLGCTPSRPETYTTKLSHLLEIADTYDRPPLHTTQSRPRSTNFQLSPIQYHLLALAKEHDGVLHVGGAHMGRSYDTVQYTTLGGTTEELGPETREDATRYLDALDELVDWSYFRASGITRALTSKGYDLLNIR